LAIKEIKMDKELVIDELKKGLPGLTKVWGGLLCEASSYCLECNNHQDGIKILITGLINESCKLRWSKVSSSQVINSWNDHDELVEYGATGIAILEIINFTEYTVMQRSRKGTAVDYWLCNKDEEILFQQSARMEVAGILHGKKGDIDQRLRGKIKRLSKPKLEGSSLPVFIIIVEFSHPTTKMVKQ
jgi:hypothetical protein